MNATYRKNFAEIDWSVPITRTRRETPEAKRSALSAPNFMRDCMDPVQSQLDGQMYTSKSKLRQTYKEAGVVEVGNDSSVLNPKRPKPKAPDRGAINASVSKALSQAGFGA